MKQRQTVLFEVITGSRGLDLDLPGSGTDIMRVVAHGPENYLGLIPYTKAQHTRGDEEEVVIYDLRFFCQLLLKGSFNAHLPLFFSKKKVMQVAPAFQSFLDKPADFFTYNSVKSFHGFAFKMFRKFQECQDFKAAANGLLVLDAAVEIATEGRWTGWPDGGAFLRNVKHGAFDYGYVFEYYQKSLAAWKPEDLENEFYVEQVHNAERRLSELCVEVLKGVCNVQTK